MSEASEASEGTTAQAGDPGSPAGRMRAWGALAFTFFAVLGFAGLLFARHKRDREVELNQHLTQNASRFGREAELKYQSYRDVVDNVTRILSLSIAPAELDRTANQVRNANRRELADAHSQQLTAQRDLARKIQRQAVDAAAASKQVRAESQSKISFALSAMQKAQASYEGAVSEAYAEHASVVRQIERLATARSANFEADSALGDRGSNDSEHAAGLGADAPASTRASSGAAEIDAAKSLLERAQNRFESAWRKAQAEYAVVASAWRELDAALVDANLGAARGEDAVLDAQSAELTLKRSLNSADQAKHDFDLEDAGREEASRAALSADAYAFAIADQVLPSYKRAIRGECKGKRDIAAVQVCAARKIREFNDAAGLSMVQCPASITAPTLTEDRQQLLLPPALAAGSDPNAVTRNAQACGAIPLSVLISTAGDDPEATTRNLGGFDSVGILSDDGAVLLELGGKSKLQLVKLGELGPGIAAKSKTVAGVQLGGDSYRAYIQPIKIPLQAVGISAAPPQAIGLAVFAVVRENTLETASLSLSISSYLWALIFLALGILSLPLAKLWMLGRTAAYSRFDVTLLASSASLIVLLSVILLWSLLAHLRLENRSDSQSAAVASAISKRLDKQISESMASLAQISGGPSFEKRDPVKDLWHQRLLAGFRSDNRDPCAEAHAKATKEFRFASDDKPYQVCEGVGLADFPFPQKNWNIFFVTDEAGRQLAKFVPKQQATAPVNVSDRPYFIQAKAGRGIRLEDGSGNLVPGSPRFVPELVESLTSRQMVLIVAQKFGSGVAAIESRLDMLQGVRLPLGFQFAVVDENGTILLHSNNDAHRGQNVFDEVDVPTEIRAALVSGVPQQANVSYLGTPSRVLVTPVDHVGLGWSVITIAPTSVVDVASTDMALVTLLAYGAMLLAPALAIGMVFSVLRVSRSIRRRKVEELADHSGYVLFLRPTSAWSGDYAAVGTRALCGSALLCGLAFLLGGYAPTTLLGVATYLAIFLVLKDIPGLRGGPPGPGEPCSNGKPTLALNYWLCWAGVTSALIVTPATVLFMGAYDHVTDNLLRAEQRQVAMALTEEKDCAAWTDADKSPKGCEKIVFSGQEGPVELKPAVPFLYANLMMPISWLADFLPPIGAAEVEAEGREYRAESSPRAHPPTSHLSLRSSAALLLHENEGGRAMLQTLLPELRSMQYALFPLCLLVLSGCIALVAASAVAYQSLRRLFWLDLLAQPAMPPLLIESLPNDGVRLLVHFPERGLLDELKRKQSAWQSLSRALPFDQASPPSQAFVEDLAPLLSDPHGPAWLCKIAASKCKRLIVLTTVDPWRRASLDSMKAWTQALETFRPVVLSSGLEVAPIVEQPVETNASVNLRLAPAGEFSGSKRARMEGDWLDCDAGERRLLGQLATIGYLNPNPENGPTISCLVARGILTHESLQFADTGYAAFVAATVTPKDKSSWRSDEEDSAWRALRVPLSTGVATLLAALMVSNPELGVAGALIPTLTASLPTFLKLLIQVATPKS